MDKTFIEPNMTCPVLGMIVPCHNEQDVVAFCVDRLTDLLSGLVDSGKVAANSFIVFVDDGSGDGTWEEIMSFGDGRHVYGIKLSRNYGQQNAIVAGLDFCRGRVDIAISTDADLQDDIRAVEAMIECYRKGADIVFGVHSNRSSDSWWKRTSASIFYGVMKRLQHHNINHHADFRLLSKKAMDALACFPEHNLYLRGMCAALGFNVAVVETARSARSLGGSKYSFRNMLALALDGITATTVLPLRVIAFLGLGILFASLVAAARGLYVCYFTSLPTPAWVTLTLPLCFIGSIQMLSLGIIGEYLARIHVETKHRPRYLIDRQFPPTHIDR